MKSITKDDARLTAYALGEISGAGAEEVERALASAPEAQAAVEEILEASSLLQCEFSREPELFLTNEQREGILRGQIPQRSLDKPLPWAVETFSANESAPPAPMGSGAQWIAVAAALVAVFIVGAVVHSWKMEDGGTGMKFVRETLQQVIAGEDPPGIVAGVGESDTGPVVGVLWSDDVRETRVSLDYEIPTFDVSGGGVVGDVAEVLPEPETEVADSRGDMPDVLPSQEVFAMDPMPLGEEGNEALWLASGAGSFSGNLPRLKGRTLPKNLVMIPRSGESLGRVSRGGVGPFLMPIDEPLVPFELRSDPVAYANIRHFILTQSSLPPSELVSVGEMVNYFDYSYVSPKSALGAAVEVVECPWEPEHQLVRVAVKAEEAPAWLGEAQDIVFLVNTSESMRSATKLPVFLEGARHLIGQLGEGSRVAMVAFGGSSYAFLEPVMARDAMPVMDSVLEPSNRSHRGRSFAAAAALSQRFVDRNRLTRFVVVTDALGGASGAMRAFSPLVYQSQSPVLVLGLGREMLKEDLSWLKDRREIQFVFSGSVAEARRSLVAHLSGPGDILAARDAHVDVEFNPANARAYRLLTTRVREGEAASILKGGVRVFAGQEATALYEVIPASSGSVAVSGRFSRPLKYRQAALQLTESARTTPGGNELLTVRVSYKNIGNKEPARFQTVVARAGAQRWEKASDDLRFAAAVTGFGMLLADFDYVGDLSFDKVIEIAEGTKQNDPAGLRDEFLELVRVSKSLAEP